MPYKDKELCSAQNRLTAYRRYKSPPEIERVEREFGAELIAARIREVAASLPPLTLAQRDRLAILLRASSHRIPSRAAARNDDPGGEAA